MLGRFGDSESVGQKLASIERRNSGVVDNNRKKSVDVDVSNGTNTIGKVLKYVVTKIMSAIGH